MAAPARLQLPADGLTGGTSYHCFWTECKVWINIFLVLRLPQ